MISSPTGSWLWTSSPELARPGQRQNPPGQTPSLPTPVLSEFEEIMKHPRRAGIAAIAYTGWALSLYFVASTSDYFLIIAAAIAAGVAIPATWWAIQTRTSLRAARRST